MTATDFIITTTRQYTLEATANLYRVLSQKLFLLNIRPTGDNQDTHRKQIRRNTGLVRKAVCSCVTLPCAPFIMES